jgi:2,5-diketo-D-gluconate reductase A
MDNESTTQLHTGSKMPVIGYGTWGIQGSVKDATEAAISAGYHMIDTSGDYGSQPGIGAALEDSSVLRSSIYLVTKVEETDNAYQATVKNLAELSVEYVDLLLIHRPPKEGIGENLWRDLIRTREEDKTRDIGVSNYSEQQIQTLADLTGVLPVVNQIEWSPFGWSRQMADFCLENNIIIQSYSPLTHGKRLDDGQLLQIGLTYNKTPSQVLIRWNMQHGWVPIVKAENPAHIEENIDVFDFELTDEDMDVLDQINENFSALGDRPVYQQNG